MEKRSAAGASDEEKKQGWKDNEAHQTDAQMSSTEVVQKPSLKSILATVFTLQTLVPGACYFCTFGAELSINSILGTYYKTAFHSLSLQASGN
ncbi:hypothetical protein EJ07DRAFT_174837 [Lizonia empirigonia]|nr:hypothetical protein EJ07DRAFT_174837 [Lizonia empirigonia]